MTEAASEILGSNLQVPAKRGRPKGVRSAKTVAAAPAVADVDKTWIVLEENEDIPPGGQFFGHNGVGYMLLPGVPAFVPNFLLEILDHAITLMPTIDPITRQVLGYRERHRFPYRRTSAPVEA